MLLEIKELTKQFGGLTAVSQLDMYVNEGEIVGLIGPNGAGKTTVFNLVTGVLRPTAGKVMFDGKDITGKSPHLVAKLGIGRTFQLNPLFADFTVLENVVASSHLRPRSSLLDIYFNTATYRRNEAHILDESLEILRLVGLDKVKDELAKNLSHGYQKALSITRALAVKPKLLLLDEPATALSQDKVEMIMGLVTRLREAGTTIVLIEHNMRAIMDYCDRIVVLAYGKKIADGLPQEIRENKEVIEAYQGLMENVR